MQELTKQDLSIVSGGGWWSDLGKALDKAIDKAKGAFGSAHGSASASFEHCTTVTNNKGTFKQCDTYSGKAEASGSASVGRGEKGKK